MSKAVHSATAPQFPLPFSHAVVAGDYVYVSGQVGVDPQTLALAGNTIEEQTKQCLRNVELILQEQGLTLDHVVKANAYIGRVEDIAGYNATYREVFRAPYPARTSVPVFLGDYLVEIDVVAYAPSPRT